MEALKEKYLSRLLYYYHTIIYSIENLTQDHYILGQYSIIKLVPKVKLMSPTPPFVQAHLSDMHEYELRDCTCSSNTHKAHRSHLANLPVPPHIWEDKVDTGKVSFFCPGHHWCFEVPTPDSRPNDNKK